MQQKTNFCMHLTSILSAITFLRRLLFRGMKKDGYGRIINIISTSVKIPLKNLGVSNTIRGAVASWAKTMANELGQFGITVNNVLPGFTTTQRLASIIHNTAEKKEMDDRDCRKEMMEEVPARRFADAVGNRCCRSFSCIACSWLCEWYKHSCGWWQNRKHLKFVVSRRCTGNAISLQATNLKYQTFI